MPKINEGLLGAQRTAIFQSRGRQLGAFHLLPPPIPQDAATQRGLGLPLEEALQATGSAL